jgi:hypothetical protein
MGGGASMIYALPLQTANELLRHRIVQAIARTTHAAAYTLFNQPVIVDMRGIWITSTRMMHQSTSTASGFRSLTQKPRAFFQSRAHPQRLMFFTQAVEIVVLGRQTSFVCKWSIRLDSTLAIFLEPRYQKKIAADEGFIEGE